jgi:hypothetical protein
MSLLIGRTIHELHAVFDEWCAEGNSEAVAPSLLREEDSDAL